MHVFTAARRAADEPTGSEIPASAEAAPAVKNHIS
jgi:hypothetical protein